MEIQKLSQLYKQVTGEDPVSVVEMPSSGSNRRYFRLSGVQSLVGAVGTCVEENRAFISIAQHFAERGLPVPKVVACSEDEMVSLQQD